MAGDVRKSGENMTRVDVETVQHVLTERALALRLPQHALVTSPFASGHVPLLFPGSFNPLHAGHRQMLAIAERRMGCRAALEIAIRNVDKPPLTAAGVAARVPQLGSINRDCFLTGTPQFVQKAELFRGTTFIVGADTAIRLCSVRYYGHDAGACTAAVEAIKERGCRFLVFGRLVGNDFVAGPQIEIPINLKEICTFIEESEFRADVSSSEIRKNDLGPGEAPD